MTPKRIDKFKKVASQRQLDLTVVFENVHDPHNIGAVMRTCDAVGISEIYVLYTDERLQHEFFKLGKRASSSARKWVQVNYYHDLDKCMSTVQNKYKNLFATHLSETANSLYELDLKEPMAFVFGNEREGLSKEALNYCNGNFIIPQMGMVESLNISVACAITLYETYRQRQSAGLYENSKTNSSDPHQSMYEKYIDIHEGRIDVNEIKVIR